MAKKKTIETSETVEEVVEITPETVEIKEEIIKEEPIQSSPVKRDNNKIVWVVINKDNIIMDEFNSEQEAIDLQRRFNGSKILLRF